MKRLFLLVLSFYVAVSSFAAGSSAIVPVKKAADIFIPIGSTGTKISLQALSQIKIKEWEAITGYKMKLADKVGFKAAQRQLKQSINADGTLNGTLNGTMAGKAMKSGNGETGFHLGGFALGFLLGLIGVLIAYLIKDDKRRNRRKWAWIGLVAYVLLYIIFFL